MKKISNSDIFSSAFKAALEAYGLKQKQISEKTGIPTGRISEYVSGKIKPGVQVQIKIAEAFGIGLSHFFSLATLASRKQRYPTHLLDGWVADMLTDIATAFGYESSEITDYLDTGEWERKPVATPSDPEAAEYLQKAKSILESGGDNSKALKAIIDVMAPQ